MDGLDIDTFRFIMPLQGETLSPGVDGALAVSAAVEPTLE